jgi:hypothetical protein
MHNKGKYPLRRLQNRSRDIKKRLLIILLRHPNNKMKMKENY